MSLKIAIVGNSKINIGIAMAGDLTLAGHDVHFYIFPEENDTRIEIEKFGGILLDEPTDQTICKMKGLANPILENTIESAVKDAEIIVLDLPPLEIEEKFSYIILYLHDDQIVHFNTHGYWSVLRVMEQPRKSGKS